MKKRLQELEQEALKALEAANDAEGLKALRVQYLGRKGCDPVFAQDVHAGA